MSCLAPRFFRLAILIPVLLICTVAMVTGQTSETKPKPTGSISGKATLSGKAAPGIAIAAYGGEDLVSRRAAARAVTDTEGGYRLFGLGPGQYQVMVMSPTLIAAEPPTFPVSGPMSNGPSKMIVLAPGETVDDIDLKLVRGGVITGRIKDAEGKVVVEQRIALQRVDEKGAPVRITGPLPFSPQMYQTDDRGIYRVYGLPAGFYKVSAGTDPARGSMNYGGRVSYPLTFYPDATDMAKATPIELSEGGEASNIDIQFGRRSETFTATGRIINTDSGQPLSGIRFMFGPAPKTQPYFSGFVGGLMTNSRGEFRIEGIEPGRYGVSVSSELESGNIYSDPAFFEITDADVSNIEVKATSGLSINGVVVLEGVPNKDALAQFGSMRITASVTSNSKPQTFNSGSAMVAYDGSFSISGLRPGRAALFLAPQPNQTGRLIVWRIERDGVDISRNLDLQAGQSLSNVRVITIFGTGTIRGTVKFENGELPPAARVYVGARREGSPSLSLGAQLDSRGHFVINNAPAGTYEVTVNVGAAPLGPQPPQRLPPPPKQFATVVDYGEAEVTFVVDLKPGGVAP
ncbi:MAG TPA: carboxypeptidase regulatory-like domain-containing protein [Pyrinomonadaceae bacterium]|nr:carboxypeptidase regulatory-like domain-containing protein [Pyrinomonadaceae bacterium]